MFPSWPNQPPCGVPLWGLCVIKSISVQTYFKQLSYNTCMLSILNWCLTFYPSPKLSYIPTTIHIKLYAKGRNLYFFTRSVCHLCQVNKAFQRSPVMITRSVGLLGYTKYWIQTTTFLVGLCSSSRRKSNVVYPKVVSVGVDVNC